MARRGQSLLLLVSLGAAVVGCAGSSGDAPVIDWPPVVVDPADVPVAPVPDVETDPCAFPGDPLCPDTPIRVPPPHLPDW